MMEKLLALSTHVAHFCSAISDAIGLLVVWNMLNTLLPWGL